MLTNKNDHVLIKPLKFFDWALRTMVTFSKQNLKQTNLRTLQLQLIEEKGKLLGVVGDPVDGAAVVVGAFIVDGATVVVGAGDVVVGAAVVVGASVFVGASDVDFDWVAVFQKNFLNLSSYINAFFYCQ